MKSKDIFNSFQEVWRLNIISVDNQSITIGSMVIGLFCLILGILISRRMVKKILSLVTSKFTLDKSSTYLLELCLFYVALLLVVLFSLKIANIPITVFTLLGGALAIGVGFGSQAILNNFMSGIVIIFERPIKVGDFINNDNDIHEVESIGLRSTKLKTFGNQHIFIPNSKIIESKLTNFTYKNNIVRTGVSFSVSYGTQVKILDKIIIDGLKSHGRILTSPAIKVLFTDFADSSLNFRVEFSLKIFNVDDKRFIESDVRYMILNILKDNKISIPFPQRDININSTLLPARPENLTSN